MENGIVYISFGKQYERLAAHTIAYSRQFTDVPITVITNVQDLDPKWAQVKDINFITLPWGQDRNREVKTSLPEFSPYEKTLYLDCDAIIQKPGIERVFDLIQPDKLLLNIYGRWTTERQIMGLYGRTMRLSGLTLPIDIYYGAINGFQKGEKVTEFFNTWQTLWRKSGSGREMPALACAVRKSGIQVVEIGNKDGIFTWLIRDNFIIQHEYGQHVRRLVGCPDFEAYKPFDRRKK